MAESITLVTQARPGRGTRAARKLRKGGLIPAVLYGHKEETIPLALPAEELRSAVRHGARVIDLSSDGNVQKALIRELQWDHLGKELLHVDFARIAVDERVTISVPLELKGTAPGVTGGGVLDQPLHSLHIECLAIAIPESIRVNIGELQIGSVIHVKDVPLPADMKAMDPPDAIVVQVTQKLQPVEVEVPGVAPVAEQAEPEIIGRKVAEEEEAE